MKLLGRLRDSALSRRHNDFGACWDRVFYHIRNGDPPRFEAGPSVLRCCGGACEMTGKYYRENEWWVSPYNFQDEVRAKFDLPARVEIHDATLRDGEQT